jgi:hypothetical protein
MRPFAAPSARLGILFETAGPGVDQGAMTRAERSARVIRVSGVAGLIGCFGARGRYAACCFAIDVAFTRIGRWSDAPMGRVSTLSMVMPTLVTKSKCPVKIL